MRHVLYVSAASETFRESDLESILESSRRNNPGHGITGMLLYMDLGFLQVVEGPGADVENVLSAIRKDSRHEDICVLIDRTSPERLFAGWSMGFDRLDGKHAEEKDIFAVTRDAIRHAVLRESDPDFATLLSTFYLVNSPHGAA